VTLEGLAAQPFSQLRRFVVMSAYVQRKITVLGPAQIEQVRLGFASRAETATTIIVIGAKPNGHDTHV
jgi:hypothetical protein